MKVVTAVREMQQTSDDLLQKGKRIALVPTMGYLHEGHLSLVRIAKQKSDAVIMTVFVNPTQFGPHEDFSRYPRDLERDKQLAESCGADILFLPETKEMYSANHHTSVEVEKLTGVLEGKSRPAHFRGVVTIVAKLFNCTKPHIAIFGQKDAQQVVVIQQMVRDLNYDVQIIMAPIVREADGLAMSSRNTFLSPEERSQSTVLYKSLQLAEDLISKGERRTEVIRSAMKNCIAPQSLARIDYISLATARTLEEISALGPGDAVLISLAVVVGTTRLIDNVIIDIKS